MNACHRDLQPWRPLPTALPAEWTALVESLTQDRQFSTHCASIYILDIRYDAKKVGDLLRNLGLPWQVVMAAYLWEYDEEVIRNTALPDVSMVISCMKAANMYAHYIEEEKLSLLLVPPYDDVGALLLAAATYLQTLHVLQEQSGGQQYTGKMYTSIENICFILRNIFKLSGVWQLKREVEDLGEQLRSPRKFRAARQELSDILQRDMGMVEKARQSLLTAYQEATQQPMVIETIPCGVMGMKRRLQSLAGTAQKVTLTGFDLVTFYVIVPTVQDCYTAFGVLSQMGHIQERVVEQLTSPKPNGNSSIYLKLLLDLPIASTQLIPALSSCSCHLHIETHFMHAITWYGCLYPPCYPLYMRSEQPEITGTPTVTQLWRSEEGKALLAIKEDLFHRKVVPDAKTPIVVFDKDRRPVALPKGSTALDFAYTLDTRVGEHAVEALVNARKSPLYRILDAGDIVEIRTASDIQAQEYWLQQNYSRTLGARRKIKESISRRLSDRDGYNRLREILERYHYLLAPETLDEELRQLVKQHHLGTPLEYLERLNTRAGEPYTPDWAAQQIMEQIAERNEISPAEMGKFSWIPALNRQMVTQKIKFRQQRVCDFCRPTYPDDINIVGRLRKRSGELIVHKESCPRLVDSYSNLYPMVWQPQPPPFRITFFLIAQDRDGLVLDLTRLLRTSQCSLLFLHAETTGFREARLRFSIETHSDKEAMDIWQAVESIDNVAKVGIDASTTAPRVLHRLQSQRKRNGIPVQEKNGGAWKEAMVLQPPRNSTLINRFDISRPAAPTMFYGRSRETTSMWDTLCAGEQGQAQVLYGPLRSGKSSLCNNFIDQQLHAPLWGVVHSLQNSIWHDETAIFMQLAETILTKFTMQFQMPVRGWQDFQDTDPLIRFRHLLQSCLAHVPQSRLILALDEFGSALDSYQKDILSFRFFTYWRELIDEVPQLSLIFALPTGSYITLSSKDFSNVFSFAKSLKISFLDAMSAQQLLIDPLREQSIEVHPTTAMQALTLTGGSPYYMTMLGQQLIEQLNRDVHIQLITATELRAAVDHIIEKSAPSNFDFLKKELQQEEEYRVLEAIVDLTGKLKQSKVQRKRIADSLKMPLQEVRRHLDRLRMGQILDENGPPSNPYYSFKIELVRKWLLRNRSFFDPALL